MSVELIRLLMARKEGLGRIASHLLFPIFIGNFITIAVSGLMFIAIARLLGPSNYGLYTLAVSFYLLIDSVGNLGIGSYFNRYLAEYTDSGKTEKIGQTVISGYIVLLIVGSLLTLLALAISPYFANVLYRSTGISTLTLRLASIAIFFFIASGSTYSALIGIRKGKLAALVSVVTNVSEFIIAVGLVYLGYGVDGALAGLVLGYVFGVFVGLIALYRSLRELIPGALRFHVAKELRNALSFSLPLAGKNFLANFTYYAAVLVLGLYVSTAVVGNYGTAIRGVGLLQVVYGNVTTVLLPTFSIALARMVKRRGSRASKPRGSEISAMYDKTIFFSLLISLPLVIYIGAMSKPLIFLFLGSKYTLAPFYLTLIAAGVVMNMIGLYTSSLFVAGGYIIKALKYELIADILALASLFLLVPYIGAVGSIIAVFFIGSLAGTCLFASGASRLFGARLRVGRIARMLAAGLVFGAILYATTLVAINYHTLPGMAEAAGTLLLGVILSVLLLPVFLVASGAASMEDARYLRHATRRLFFAGRMFSYITAYMEFLVARIGR